MTVAAAHQLNSILIDTDAVADTTIGGITRKTINTGIEILKENSSGSLYPEAAYVVNAAPSASLTTTHLNSVISNVGTRGLCITSAATGTGVHMWARQLACAGIVAGANHQKYTFRNGIIVPIALNCDHQGNGSIDLQVFGVATSSLLAMVVAASQAINTTNTPNTARWTLYDVQVAGTTLASWKSLSIDFGNVPIIESGDSDASPTFASVQETSPIVTIRGIDPVNWWAVSGGLSGAACTHANTVIRLRKREVALGTAEHLLITIAGTARSNTALDANGNAAAEQDIVIDGVEDSSSTAPMTMTFGAIS